MLHLWHCLNKPVTTITISWVDSHDNAHYFAFFCDFMPSKLPFYKVLRHFIQGNQHYFYCLPPYQLELANYFLACVANTNSNDSDVLLSICKTIVREKRKLAYLKGNGDYIEGLDMHNIDKKLYDFCKSIRLNTIHELDSFVIALKSASSQASTFRIKYPQGTDLIAFYDRYRYRDSDSIRNP